MLFSWICNVRHSFLVFFRTWSFTLFTNSAASLPMTKVSESASSWKLALSSCPDPSWIISPYLTECAFPSRRASPWWGQIWLHHIPRSFIRFPRSIVRRNLTFPLLRRPRTIIIRFWITCWRESIRLPWSIIYHNRFPRILIYVPCLPRAWWSWRRHDRWHPRSKIHHRSWFCSWLVLLLILVEIVSPLQQSKL